MEAQIMTKGKLFVISGASGVGKSTVLASVMAKRKDLSFSVSATTREPRPRKCSRLPCRRLPQARWLACKG